MFVELTAQSTHQLDPKLVEDDLLFVQENGQEQAVNFRAWAWDAKKLYDPVIEKDTVIESAEPLVIYGDLTVKEGAELTLRNTTLYFHDAGGMEIYGSLKTEDCVLRGDRLDRMFVCRMTVSADNGRASISTPLQRIMSWWIRRSGMPPTLSCWIRPNSMMRTIVS